MTWGKGQSGNPGGRRKLTPGQKRALEKARKLSFRAMERMAEMLEDDEPRTVLAAAKLVLEYGLGKPTQVADVHVTTDRVEDLPRAEQIAGLRAAADALESEVEAVEGMH